MKERLDVLVAGRGLAPSREKAKAMIMAWGNSGGRTERRQARDLFSRYGGDYGEGGIPFPS